MIDLRKQHFIRCGRKRAYRQAKHADEAAQRASLKTGELIISYQCYECLKWHIGHADQSQILARTSPGYPICEICGRRIEVDRLDKAKREGTRITTCSKACQRELMSRNTQQPPPPFSSEQQPEPPKPRVPKGLSTPGS